jgi:hypothetical protein
VADVSAMLFNLTDELFFAGVTEHKLIGCSSNSGPWFGGEKADLCISSEPFDGKNKGFSYTFKSMFDIQLDGQTRNRLTREIGDKFTLSNIEVW